MAQSARYKQLLKRISELDANLLPAVSPTGTYTQAEYDRTRAYRVLAHAEIEACLEDLVHDVADQAFRRWAKDGRSRRPLLGLLAYHEGALQIRPILRTVGAPPEQIKDKAQRAKDDFCNRVRTTNNGIREQNVLAMLLPVGVALSDIDNAWLATIDSFGLDRGRTAHQSAAKATLLPDPATERATVGQIVAGIGSLDSKLRPLRA